MLTEEPNRPWYASGWVMIASGYVFPPLGLYLMWRYKDWPASLKTRRHHHRPHSGRRLDLHLFHLRHAPRILNTCPQTSKSSTPSPSAATSTT